MLRQKAWSLVLIALIGLAAGGCESGCGEEPKKAEQSSGGGGGASPSGGSGQVAMGPGFDGKSSEKKGQTPPANRYDSKGERPDGSAKEQADAVLPSLHELNAGNYRKTVLRAGLPTLVMIDGTSCRECPAMRAAVRSLVAEFDGKLRMGRLDSNQVGAPGLLPKGMSPRPLPGLILYDKNGKPTTRRQAVPFTQDKGESDGEYAGRLRKWLRDALALGDLKFGPK